MHPNKMINKKVAIWGMGREGRSVLSRLKDEPLELLCVDDHTTGQNTLDSDGLQEKIRENKVDIIIKSPGISLYHPIIKLAKERGVQVTSATNMWVDEHKDSKVVVVTGTKGKSTTSSLIYFLLKKAGINAALGGNVGIPLYELGPGHAITVIEMSSYQLADFGGCVDAVVFLNLFPEHAPWHITHEQYYKDKTSILSKAKETVILSKDLEKNYGHLLAPNVKIERYDDSSGYHVLNNDLFFDRTVVTPTHLPLKGQHNLWNLAAACTLLSVLGIDAKQYLNSLGEFAGLPHRLQEIVEINGVLFVDDSISTIPQSTVHAVTIYASRKIALILGGTDRSQDYVWLAKALVPYHNQIKAIYTIPDNGERIVREFRETNYPGSLLFVPDLETAVKKSRAILTGGGVVLFSPAAPRSQRFADFDARGSLFAQCAAE